MKSQCFYFFFIIFIIHIIYIFFERRLRNNYESIYLFTIQRTWFNHQHIWIKLKLYPINITSSTFLTPLRLIQNSCPGSISALLIRFRFHVRAISPLSLSLSLSFDLPRSYNLRNGVHTANCWYTCVLLLATSHPHASWKS